MSRRREGKATTKNLEAKGSGKDAEAFEELSNKTRKKKICWIPLMVGNGGGPAFKIEMG